MGDITKFFEDAKDFIRDSDERTASFSLTKEQYKQFTEMDLPEGYKIILENLNLNENNYKIVLGKGDFNFLIGEYL